jgi:hypothetical protein
MSAVASPHREVAFDKAAPAILGGNLLLPALRDVNLSSANPDGMGLEPAVEPGKIGLVPNSPGFLLGDRLRLPRNGKGSAAINHTQFGYD